MPCPNCDRNSFVMQVEAPQYGWVWQGPNNERAEFEANEIGTIEPQDDPPQATCRSCETTFEITDHGLVEINNDE